MLDVVVPGLADQADHVGAGGEQRRQLLVVLRADALAPRRAEGSERGVLQVELGLGSLKELVVFWIGPGPAALDVGDAEVVEEAGHDQLVVGGERDALLLGAVAQGGVVDLD